jgi:regulator of sirC expression with transglutaminase-like and TPR domain
VAFGDDLSEARRRLTALVAGPDHELDLPTAVLLVAQEEYPSLETERYLAELERLGNQLRTRLPDALSSAPDQVLALNALLFTEEGFCGNSKDYYDPRNSYLNEVLDRRTGLPITLSLVYVEVGRRAGLPLFGVGFPSHFLVSYGDGGTERLLIDPFRGGRILSTEDCERLLRASYGESVALQPWHLEPSSARQILTRVITNLKVAYLRQGDMARALRSSEQLSVVAPSPAELRDRGIIAYRLGKLRDASRNLKQYLDLVPDAEDADVVRQYLQQVRELRERRN